MTTPKSGPATAETLRALAWTIQRQMPVRAGVPPVPLTELVVLKRVIESPTQSATVGELADALDLQQPNVSAAVRGLVERGLVTRETDAVDRRVTRIVPTDRARAERRAIGEAWSGDVERALATLEPDQLAALERALPALEALEAAIGAARTLRRDEDSE